MHNKEDIYSNAIRNITTQNMREVVALLEQEDSSLITKIRNASKKYGIPEQQIRENIKNELPIALAFFSKDPKKQNVYEKIAANYIKKIQGVTNFQNLPNNKFFVVNGKIVTKEHKQLSNAKTIDFYFEYNSKKIYASHKYTKDKGGAQDHQYKDLQNFINNVRDNTDRETIFIAIADGDYYNTKDNRADLTKIKNLKAKCTKTVKVCTIYDLQKELQTL